MIRRTNVTGFVLLTAAMTSHAGNVWVVDGTSGPGSSHSSIGDAIAAAADGDIVLVRSGSYVPFTLKNKSLEIVADAGADVEVGPFWNPTRIQDVALGKRVLIRGIRFTTIPFGFGSSVIYIPGISISNSVGVVELEDVSSPGAAGIEIVSCTSAILSRVSCTGVAGTVLLNSTIVATDCSFVGVDGYDAASSLGHHLPQISTRGAAGISVAFGGVVTLSGCTVSGGQGGDGLVDFDGSCLPASSGGPAILVSSGATTIRIVGNQASLLPGPPGSDAAPCTSSATTGLPIENSALVTHAWFTETPLEFKPPAVAREGQTLSIGMSGPAVFAHWLVSASSAANPWLPAGVGHLLVANPFVVLPIGTAPTPPNWNLTFTVPELGPGVSGVSLRIQAIGCAGASTCVLGGNTSVVVLDSSY